MNTKQLADLVSGQQYPFRMPAELDSQAKESGLVVVYGSSDDLMEFRGAINDEIGAWNGTVAFVDRHGLLADFDRILASGHDIQNKLRNYFKREGSGIAIKAVWGALPYSWTYETRIPHDTFEIVEDGEPFCRGIVFSLTALGLWMTDDYRKSNLE